MARDIHAYMRRNVSIVVPCKVLGNLHRNGGLYQCDTTARSAA